MLEIGGVIKTGTGHQPLSLIKIEGENFEMKNLRIGLTQLTTKYR
jgi:hypothetical protein